MDTRVFTTSFAHDGRRIAIGYRVLTSADRADLDRRYGGEERTCRRLAAELVHWDLEDGAGHPVPTTYAALAALPADIRGVLAMAIHHHVRQWVRAQSRKREN